MHGERSRLHSCDSGLGRSLSAAHCPSRGHGMASFFSGMGAALRRAVGNEKPADVSIETSAGAVTFTADETKLYSLMFTAIDSDDDSQIGGGEGAVFLRRSGLSDEVLRKVRFPASAQTARAARPVADPRQSRVRVACVHQRVGFASRPWAEARGIVVRMLPRPSSFDPSRPSRELAGVAACLRRGELQAGSRQGRLLRRLQARGAGAGEEDAAASAWRQVALESRARSGRPSRRRHRSRSDPAPLPCCYFSGWR